MRDIKFRAWDKESDIMVFQHDMNLELENKEYLFSLNEESVELLYYDEDYSAYVNCDADIMQYTGLKDKNGKEIYEGDVLDYGEFGKYKVVFSKASFKIQKLDNLNGNLHLLGECFLDEIEVVGNIYEIPELLK